MSAENKFQGDQLEQAAREIAAQMSPKQFQNQSSFIHPHYFPIIMSRSTYEFEKPVESALVQIASENNSWQAVIEEIRTRISNYLPGMVGGDPDSCQMVSILSLCLAISIDAISMYGDSQVIGQ